MAESGGIEGVLGGEPAVIDETPQDTRDEPIIVALAEKFRVSAQHVKAIYGKERRRLESGLRIQVFLDVLAIGSTRTILRNLEHTSGELH